MENNQIEEINNSKNNKLEVKSKNNKKTKSKKSETNNKPEISICEINNYAYQVLDWFNQNGDKTKIQFLLTNSPWRYIEDGLVYNLVNNKNFSDIFKFKINFMFDAVNIKDSEDYFDVYFNLIIYIYVNNKEYDYYLKQYLGDCDIYMSHQQEMTVDFKTFEKIDYKIPLLCIDCGKHRVYENTSCESCLEKNYIPDDICSICHESQKVNFVTLKCRHKFHRDCIKKVENKKCPLCKANFE